MSMFSYLDFFADPKKTGFKIEPFDPEAVQPSSIDLRLDNRFRFFPDNMYEYIDPREEQPELTRYKFSGDYPYFLMPGEFILGSTQEVVTLSNQVTARLEGKSSLARLGLIIHSAGLIDAGFSGNITLELSNLNKLPIKLYAGMKIGQICVFKLNSVSPVSYGDDRIDSRYQGQRGPTPSRSHKNFTIKQLKG